MFCPKCGTQAISGTKFCRSCGADLDVVSAALSGALVVPGKKSPQQCKKDALEGVTDPDKLFSSFITNGLSGLAFIAIALFLTITNTIGGSVWGFWLLIPGASLLGSGVASYLKAKRIEKSRSNYLAAATAGNAFSSAPPEKAALPNSANYASLPPESAASYYSAPSLNTGELVTPPASVTEHTTRHLQTNSEGETVNFPQPK